MSTSLRIVTVYTGAAVCLYRQSECVRVCSPASSTWAVPQPRALLTDLLACCDRLFRLQWWTLADCIEGIYSEVVSYSLFQASNFHICDWSCRLANLCPGLFGGLAFLQRVVSDWGATVMVRLVPVQ